MRDLLNNYARCDATRCNIKDTCARYTSTPTQFHTADFSLMVKTIAQCTMFEGNADE